MKTLQMQTIRSLVIILVWCKMHDCNSQSLPLQLDATQIMFSLSLLTQKRVPITTRWHGNGNLSKMCHNKPNIPT